MQAPLQFSPLSIVGHCYLTNPQSFSSKHEVLGVFFLCKTSIQKWNWKNLKFLKNETIILRNTLEYIYLMMFSLVIRVSHIWRPHKFSREASNIPKLFWSKTLCQRSIRNQKHWFVFRINEFEINLSFLKLYFFYILTTFH